jgi:hypothetical protein
MGWGITIPDVYYSRIKISELKDRKADLDYLSRIIREKLLMWAVTDIKSINIPNSDSDDPINYIHLEVSQLIDELEKNARELQMCYLALDNKDTIKDT